MRLGLATPIVLGLLLFHVEPLVAATGTSSGVEPWSSNLVSGSKTAGGGATNGQSPNSIGSAPSKQGGKSGGFDGTRDTLGTSNGNTEDNSTAQVCTYTYTLCLKMLTGAF